MEPNEQSAFKRNLILNTKVPLIIENSLNCDLTSWSLERWASELGGDFLKFRCGKREFTKQPQWESACSLKEATFEHFLEHSKSDNDEWWYFDYKYLSQWFTDKVNITKKIDWSQLGFPEMTSKDSTIWIGSKQAHTPCHVDTYGCNMVLQIFGRKQWLLFPPEQNLKPTRIPFEESSIYSKLNFFSPQVNDFKGVANCYRVILNPGQVLVVPNKWWHYVENLDTAISINAWLPLDQDEFQRVKEGIASVLVQKMLQNQNELQNFILNPNMKTEMGSTDVILSVIKASKQSSIHKNKRKQPNQLCDSNGDVEELLKRCNDITKVPLLSDSEFRKFLIDQSERFSHSGNSSSSSKIATGNEQIISFIEAITDDEVLDLVAKKLTF